MSPSRKNRDLRQRKPKTSAGPRKRHSEPIDLSSLQTEENTQAGVIWRVATAADMAALRVIHFDCEVASGQAVNLSDQLFEAGDVLVAGFLPFFRVVQFPFGCHKQFVLAGSRFTKRHPIFQRFARHLA